MAFESGWIESEEDQKYVLTKGFRGISGRLLSEIFIWAIDRERDIILISRGGGGLEMPKSYALYMDGEIINIEGDSEEKGSHFDNTLKVHWYINKIEVTEGFFQKGYDKNKVNQIIREAFTSYSYCDLEPEQIVEVTVEIKAEFQREQSYSRMAFRVSE